MAFLKYIHKNSSKIKEYFCPQLGTSGHILRAILCNLCDEFNYFKLLKLPEDFAKYFRIVGVI